MMPKSYYRILEIIASQQGARVGEIVKKANVSVQTAMRIIEELLQQGIIAETVVRGGKKIITRTLYPQLESEEGRVVFSLFELEKRAVFIRRNPSLIMPFREIAQLSDIPCILVFGSFANFSQTDESDLDLLFLVRKSYDKERVRRAVERSFVTFDHEVSLKAMSFTDWRKSNLYGSIMRNHVVMKGIQPFL